MSDFESNVLIVGFVANCLNFILLLIVIYILDCRPE